MITLLLGEGEVVAAGVPWGAVVSGGEATNEDAHMLAAVVGDTAAVT
jgi:hypothetical protein